MAAKVKGFDRIENIFKHVPKDQRKQKLSEWGKKGKAAQIANQPINRWVNAVIEDAMTSFASFVHTYMTDNYYSIVEGFYNHYSNPSMYDRTDSLKHAIEPVFEKAGKTYTIGVKIDSSNIVNGTYVNLFDYNGSKAGQPSDVRLTFENFYFHGRHGNNIVNKSGKVFWTAPQMSKSPHEYMNYYWDLCIKRANKKLNAAIKEAAERNRKLLKG